MLPYMVLISARISRVTCCGILVLKFFSCSFERFLTALSASRSIAESRWPPAFSWDPDRVTLAICFKSSRGIMRKFSLALLINGFNSGC